MSMVNNMGRLRAGAGIVVLIVLALAAPLRAAEESNGIETKLREALRDTMLKLRDAQGQIATAQAAQIAAEEKIKELTTKNESLTKDLFAERTTSTNMIAELNTKLTERGTVITSLQAKVEKWKKSYSELTAFAAHKEAERAKYMDKTIKLERQVANQQAKNLEMYKAGMDTLNRYEKFGLGDAILAREPFIGTTKVKFENLIQDQADKLTDARIQEEKTEAKTQAAETPQSKPQS
jgi:chromosome segregation ATPase